MRLCYIDAETTGLEQKDRLCSLGVIIDEAGRSETLYELINPGRKIPPAAMAVHHITNEMVAEAPEFALTRVSERLEALNNPETIHG